MPAYAAAKHGVLGLVRRVSYHLHLNMSNSMDDRSKRSRTNGPQRVSTSPGTLLSYLYCLTILPNLYSFSVAPGYINTEKKTNPTRSRQILERIPQSRWGLPDDFAGVVVFLASRARDYVSGETVVVDGGWMGR